MRENTNYVKAKESKQKQRKLLPYIENNNLKTIINVFVKTCGNASVAADFAEFTPTEVTVHWDQ